MIDCCKDCVPPKRTSTCHRTCERYKAQLEAHLQEKALCDKNRQRYYNLRLKTNGTYKSGGKYNK